LETKGLLAHKDAYNCVDLREFCWYCYEEHLSYPQQLCIEYSRLPSIREIHLTII